MPWFLMHALFGPVLIMYTILRLRTERKKIVLDRNTASYPTKTANATREDGAVKTPEKEDRTSTDW